MTASGRRLRGLIPGAAFVADDPAIPDQYRVVAISLNTGGLAQTKFGELVQSALFARLAGHGQSRRGSDLTAVDCVNASILAEDEHAAPPRATRLFSSIIGSAAAW